MSSSDRRRRQHPGSAPLEDGERVPPGALGSLTQPGAATGLACNACGSTRITRIAVDLTDGSPVELTSCQACEHRTWTEHGKPLSVARVLDKARKQRPGPAPDRR